MENSEKFLRAMIAYGEIRTYSCLLSDVQPDSKPENLPDQKLKSIIKHIWFYKKLVSEEIRSQLPRNKYVNRLETECSRILSNRRKKRVKMETLLGKSSQ